MTSPTPPSTEPSRPRLRVLSAAAFLLVLAAGAAALALLHAPRLEGRIREGTGELVDAALRAAVAAREEEGARLEEILPASTGHLVDRWRRDLEDLPFELCAGDPDRTRALVVEETLRAAETSRENARVLASEMRRRGRHSLDALETTLREEQGAAAADLAAEAAFSSSLIMFGVLAALLGIHTLLLGRAVLGPVRRLADGAERLAAGERGHRVPGGGSGELDDLARGLNRMAESVERAEEEAREAQRRLTALNETLEARVEEKSRALVRAETLASIGTLAGGVAHEFNNLLGGILGTVEEALEDLPEGHADREPLELVARTARRGCTVTENLLRFARPRPPRKERLDAEAVVRDAVALVEPEAVRRGATMSVAADPLPPVSADPAELQQVVLNLLSNALHFTPPGGRIEVTLRRENGAVAISVRDTGPGLSPEVRERLFEPFFTTRGNEGTGLGLAVSHGIVRAHGGSLDARDDAAGGARFTARLPLAPETHGGDA